MVSIDLNGKKLNMIEDVAYYVPNFITEEQENYIIDKVNSAPKPKWCQLSNRRLQNWGGIVHAKGLIPEKIPNWLNGFIDQLECLKVFPETNRPNHVLINEYLPGQGIMPHVDGNLFFPTISTISCGSHTVLHFYKPFTEIDKEVNKLSTKKEYSLLLERRSLLVLQEKMYNNYMHGIEEITSDIINDSISNLKSCGSHMQNGDSLLRSKRISLTIRNVPKVSKLNLNSLMIKK